MKTLTLISLAFLLISCTTNTDFYYGTWELNKENGFSTISLSESKKLNWNLSGIRIFENVPFEVVQISPQEIDIIAGKGDDCIKLTMQKLSDNLCIGCNYKCYIDENMIDEVFILRKNGTQIEPIQKPEEETIILPVDYLGEFFIVYYQIDNNPTNTIQIDHKGVGHNPGEPDLIQLFNANRIFRFEGQKEQIPILNPSDYTNQFNLNLNIDFNESDVIVIQKGFNQSGRNKWNKEFDEEVKDNLNIEHFEIRRIIK
jgi:hypothetical protein